MSARKPTPKKAPVKGQTKQEQAKSQTNQLELYLPEIVLTIFILAIAAVFAWYFTQKKPELDGQLSKLDSEINSIKSDITVQKTKQEALPSILYLRKVLYDKIQTEFKQRRFLRTQWDYTPWLNSDFEEITTRSGIQPFKWDVKQEVFYSYKYPWADFESLSLLDGTRSPEIFTRNPGGYSIPFEITPRLAGADAAKNFTIKYTQQPEGEVTDPDKAKSDAPDPGYGIPNEFLKSQTIGFEFVGSYEDVMRFILELQQKGQTFANIHDFENDDSEYGFSPIRSTGNWKMKFTIYYGNPNGIATGDSAPELPGTL